MNRSILCAFLVGIILIITNRDLYAQGFGGLGTGGTGGATTLGSGTGAGAAGRAGLTQTGQLSSSAAIQRDAFVGRSLGFSPRSYEGQQPTSINASFGSSLGGGTGLGGGGGLGGFGGGGLGGFGGGGLGGFGGGGLGGFGGQGGFGGGGRGGFGGGAGQNQPLRTRLTIGFAHSPRSINAISDRFEKRLMSIPRIQMLTPVKVTMEQETAVLRGTVGSENDRDLVARLALLEPGISSVRNELTVAPEGSTSDRPN